MNTENAREFPTQKKYEVTGLIVRGYDSDNKLSPADLPVNYRAISLTK
jgi:hypothetical protein